MISDHGLFARQEEDQLEDEEKEDVTGLMVRYDDLLFAVLVRVNKGKHNHGR